MFGKQLRLGPETITIIEEIGKHMPGGFFIYQAKAPETLLYANQAVFDIFGCEDLEDFKKLTGYTFKGMLHPEDYETVSASILDQIEKSDENLDYVEYRIIRKDGSVRWVDDYGHYTETDAYGGVYYVFISDITEKRANREKDYAIRGAVIDTLTNAYHTVWLINDVETEACSLFHSDLDKSHEEAIHNALSHARYTETKAEYVDTMVAPEDKERMQREISLPYILEQFEKKDQFSVNFVRALPSGPRHYRIDFGKVRMPDQKIGVMMGFKDVDDEVRRERALQHALEEAKRAEEENRRLAAEAAIQIKQQELEEKLALQSRLLEQERRRKEQDCMITAM
ncbi:MAG: PAS domain-containing protein, partial [Clostridia bacterium]|nr:PAS domain-containing protein [Clostridia bacterium]